MDGANDSDSEDDDDDDEDEDDDEKDKAKDNGLDEEGEVEVSVFLRTPFSLLKVVSNNICLGLKDCDQLHRSQACANCICLLIYSKEPKGVTSFN